MTENPNTPNSGDCTPIYGAAQNGHTEIVKILAPLTDNPNAPNNSGCTPSSIAENIEIQRFLKSLKRKAEPSTNPSKK